MNVTKRWRDGKEGRELDYEAINRGGKPVCRWCAKGLRVYVLDEDGTQSHISGRKGTACHASDVYWWPCEAVK